MTVKCYKSCREKTFFSLSLFFFLPPPTFPSIFHLPFYRWASPWPVSRAGSVPARSCVKVWMNVLTWSCECAKQTEKGGTGQGAPRALGNVHNLIYFIVCFISCPCFAQGCMQICSLENKWYKSEIHPTLINVWKQRRTLFVQNPFPSSAFFHFPTPCGEQTELPMA